MFHLISTTLSRVSKWEMLGWIYYHIIFKHYCHWSGLFTHNYYSSVSVLVWREYYPIFMYLYIFYESGGRSFLMFRNAGQQEPNNVYCNWSKTFAQTKLVNSAPRNVLRIKLSTFNSHCTKILLLYSGNRNIKKLNKKKNKCAGCSLTGQLTRPITWPETTPVKKPRVNHFPFPFYPPLFLRDNRPWRRRDWWEGARSKRAHCAATHMATAVGPKRIDDASHP